MKVARIALMLAVMVSVVLAMKKVARTCVHGQTRTCTFFGRRAHQENRQGSKAKMHFFLHVSIVGGNVIVSTSKGLTGCKCMYYKSINPKGFHQIILCFSD